MSVSFPFYHWIFTLLISPVFSSALDKLFGKSPSQVIGLLEAYPVTLFGLIVTMLIVFEKEGSMLWNYLASYAIGCIVVGILLTFPDRNKVLGKYA